MNEAELDQLLDTWEAPAPPPSLRKGLVAALPVQRRTVFGVSLPLVFAAGALCAALGAAGFESPLLSRFQGQWSDEGGGLYLQATRMIAPPVTPLKSWFLGGGNSIGGTGGALHGSGHFRNRLTGSYYGYEYTLERVGDGQYRVSFSPMQLATLKRQRGPYKLDGQLVPPPDLPAPRVVQVGEPFEVTLSQDGGERVYDRIVLSWTTFPGWLRGQHGSGQNGRMRLAGPQLYVNGQLAASQRDAGSGPVIWVHLPGQGRFLVALDPQGNPRFIQAGHVSGNVVEFQSGSTQFRIVCTDPVAAGGDRPVFVYQQQSFENVLDPSHPLTGQVFLGNAGPASLHQE